MASTANIIALQQSIWGLHDTAIAGGVHLMWRRGDLHSVAVAAFNPGWQDPAYAVPMMQWATMRMLSDRYKVPSSAYIEGEKPGSVYCANWPVQAGLGYRTEADDKLGGLVVIPNGEFKLVEKKT